MQDQILTVSHLGMSIRQSGQDILVTQVLSVMAVLEVMEAMEDLVQDLEDMVVVTVDTIHLEIMADQPSDQTLRTGDHQFSSLVILILSNKESFSPLPPVGS